MKQISRYWYDPTTGEILRRTLARGTKKFDLPYFDRAEQGWNWSEWRVDVNTLELVPSENPQGQGVDPRAQGVKTTIDPQDLGPEI